MNLVMMLSDPRYLLTYRSDLRSSDDLYHSRIMWYVPHDFKSEALKQDVIYPEQVAQMSKRFGSIAQLVRASVPLAEC